MSYDKSELYVQTLHVFKNTKNILIILIYEFECIPYELRSSDMIKQNINKRGGLQ